MPFAIWVVAGMTCAALASQVLPGAASELKPPTAVIDVGAPPPMMATSRVDIVSIPFGVSCAMLHADDECDIVTTLHYRAQNGGWSTLDKTLQGLGVKFRVPVPNADHVDYYLSVEELNTGTTATFPSTGAEGPLRFFVVAPGTTRQLSSIPWGQGISPDSSFQLSWGSGPTNVGMLPGNESATIGPQGLDVDAFGNVYLLDQINGRVQVFDPSGVLVNSIPVDVGPIGDIGLVSDGSFYILDTVPDGPGSHPVVHHVTPSGTPFSPPLSVTTEQTLEDEPALLRVVNDVAWVYGTPSDAWAPLIGDVTEAARRKLTMARPTDGGYVLTQIQNLARLNIVPLDSANRERLGLTPPADRNFGELAVVEPDGSGGYWVVVRTWQDEPVSEDQHELVHLSETGEIVRHDALVNGEFADTGSLSQYRVGDDGALYQIFSDATGLEIRKFEL